MVFSMETRLLPRFRFWRGALQLSVPAVVPDGFGIERVATTTWWWLVKG